MAPGYQVVTSKPSIFAIFCSTTTFITSSKIILLFHLLPVLLPPIDESDQYPVRFLLQWNPARNISNQLSTHFIQLFLSWMLLPPAPSPLLSPACRATACWMRCSLRSVSLVPSFYLEFGAVLSFDHMPFNIREQHLRQEHLRHRLLSDRIDIFAPFLQHNLTEGKFKCLLGDENILV